MNASDLHSALLRPAVIQILKAAGFSLAKPAVIDTISDMTARYLLLLATETAQTASSTHENGVPTVQDTRLALEKVGVLQPQMKTTEELARGLELVDGVSVPFEDLRGVRNFIKWAMGPVNEEIRRVGGLAGGNSTNVEDLAAGMDDNEDYVTAIKKKHSKTAEESRYQGTLLGKDNDLQPVAIAGGTADSLSSWTMARFRAAEASRQNASSIDSASSSALSTPIDTGTPEIA